MAHFRSLVNVRKTTRNGKPVWQVDIPASKLGKRKRFFAATKEKVIAKAERLIHAQGAEAAFGALPAAVYAIAARWAGKLTAEEIDAACREYNERKGYCATAADAVKGYLSAPRETPLSAVHLGPLRVRLNEFKATFGDRRMSALTAGELNNFCREQGRSSPNYFGALRALFRYAHSMDWIAVNPFDRMKKPELAPSPKRVLTPEQMMELLRVGSDQFRRYLVLGGFCGFRHSETMRQQCEGVDRSSWEIHVEKMKTQKRGIRERYAATEANAQAWLNWLCLPASGPVIELNSRNLWAQRKEACRAAGLGSWPANALRRSFASYHLAAFENAARTAEILGHTSAETTKGKYQVARKKEQADAWFSILPPLLPGGF